jgi:hypothetical protein
MKKVERYKCDYCNKLAVHSETIENHETICIHNPNGKNCYMCEFSCFCDTWESDGPYSDYKDVCVCVINDDIQKTNEALNCEHFKRSNKMYLERDYEEVSTRIEELELLNCEVER